MANAVIEVRRVVLDLIHGITDPQARSRDVAADSVTDIVQSLNAFEAEILSAVLVAARLLETDASCQEAQLNALAELNEWNPVPKETLNHLRTLDPHQLKGSEIDHWKELGLSE